MNGEATAPLVYWAWHRALSQRLLSHRLGPPRYERLIAQRSFQETLERILTDNDSYWCDDLRTSATETCQTQIDAALTDALTELTDRLGPSVSTWQWSRVHQAVGEHRPFSRVAPLQHWFETRTHIGGDTFTVHALRVSLGGKPTDRYAAHHGPSLKALYDVKNPAASRMVHSTGQSGLPWSPHYRDLTERWKAGDTIPLWASHGETPAATLRLEP
jgi:penicillin amidase